MKTTTQRTSDDMSEAFISSSAVRNALRDCVKTGWFQTRYGGPWSELKRPAALSTLRPYSGLAADAMSAGVYLKNQKPVIAQTSQ